MRLTYSKMRAIFLKLLPKYRCNKWDMLKIHSVPFYMFPIRIRMRSEDLKFYAMIEFSRDVRAMLRMSPDRNPKSNLNMLQTNDLILFSDRLVKYLMRNYFSRNVSIFLAQLQVHVVGLMHEIDLAFGSIDINTFMEYEFVGEDGKKEKTIVAMGKKSNDIFPFAKLL